MKVRPQSITLQSHLSPLHKPFDFFKRPYVKAYFTEPHPSYQENKYFPSGIYYGIDTTYLIRKPRASDNLCVLERLLVHHFTKRTMTMWKLRRRLSLGSKQINKTSSKTNLLWILDLILTLLLVIYSCIANKYAIAATLVKTVNILV